MRKKARGKFLRIWGLLLVLAGAIFILLKVSAFAFAIIITAMVPLYVASFMYWFSKEIDLVDTELRGIEIKPYDSFSCG